MNRYLLLTGILLLLTTVATAQKKDKNAITSPVPYDSIANFLGGDVAKYKGQELWLKGLPEKMRMEGYNNFILKYKKDDDLLNQPDNIYKCCDGYYSRYADLVDKHFVVQEVLKHPNAGKNNDGYGDKYYFKLREKSGGDIVYFAYDVNSEYTFPFVVIGFLDKQKQNYIGRQYVFTNDVIEVSRDLATSQPISVSMGQKWKCADVVVDDVNFELSLLLETPNGLKITVPLSVVTNKVLPLKAYSAEEADDMRKRFGIYNYNRILQQKIGMTMTKEMCKLSWGEPLEIIENGTGNSKTEEWIYPAGSLTFRGNKLIKI